MTSIDSLRNTFNEIQESINEKTIKNVIQVTRLQLGCRDTNDIMDNPTVDALIKTINEVISNTKMQEDFLIDAVIGYINSIFEGPIRGHGNAIILQLEAQEQSIKATGKESETFKKMYDELIEVGYRGQLERDLNAWKIAVLNNFSYDERQKWLYEKMNK